MVVDGEAISSKASIASIPMQVISAEAMLLESMRRLVELTIHEGSGSILQPSRVDCNLFDKHQSIFFADRMVLALTAYLKDGTVVKGSKNWGPSGIQ